LGPVVGRNKKEIEGVLPKGKEGGDQGRETRKSNLLLYGGGGQSVVAKREKGRDKPKSGGGGAGNGISSQPKGDKAQNG